MAGQAARAAIMANRESTRDDGEPLMTETRSAVQQRESLTVNIPKPVVEMLSIEKGDDLKVDMYSDFAVIRKPSE